MDDNKLRELVVRVYWSDLYRCWRCESELVLATGKTQHECLRNWIAAADAEAVPDVAALRAEVEQAKRRADSYNEKFQRQCELTDEAVRQRMVAERAIVSAADAEAVPVAWMVTFRRNSPSIDRLPVLEKDDAAKQVAPHLIVSVEPLYARPQPANVGVLVEALRKELADAYLEMRKIRPALTAIFDRDVWDRVSLAEKEVNQ